MIIELFGFEIDLLAQLIDVFALIFIVISHQGKKSNYLIFYSIAAVFFAIEAYVLGAYSNVVCNSISIVRNLTVLYFLKKGKELPKAIGCLFSVPFFAMLVFYVIKLDFVSAAPALLCLAVSIATVCKNAGVLKTVSVFTEAGFMVYSFFIGAYIGVLRQVFAASSAAVGLIRYYSALRRKKKEALQ